MRILIRKLNALIKLKSHNQASVSYTHLDVYKRQIIWSYCVKKNLLLAGEILLLSGLTDLADGYIARRFHRNSNLGKILDPVADKPTQTAMLICLFTRFPHMLLLIVIMAGKELYMVVSGCLVIRKKGKVHGADWHGKIVTFLLYGTAAVHILSLIHICV